MPRALHIRANRVVNIVEYPGAIPETAEEDFVVPAVTGLESVGDTFDVNDTLLNRRVDKQDVMIFRELFRLTNAVRILEVKLAMTQAQYRAFIKTQG